MEGEGRTNRSEEEDVGFLKRAVAQLAEHFDTVQVFCTRHLGEAGTTGVKYGTGNWFARMGQVKEWVSGEDACVEAQQFKRINEEDP